MDEQKRRFCTQCGEPLTENQKFCSKCGHKVSQEEAPDQEASQPQNVKHNEYVPVPVSPKSNFPFSVKTVAIGVAIVVVIAAIFLFRGKGYESVMEDAVDALSQFDIVELVENKSSYYDTPAVDSNQKLLLDQLGNESKEILKAMQKEFLSDQKLIIKEQSPLRKISENKVEQLKAFYEEMKPSFDADIIDEIAVKEVSVESESEWEGTKYVDFIVNLTIVLSKENGSWKILSVDDSSIYSEFDLFYGTSD